MKPFKITVILLMAPLIFMMVFGCGEPTYTADQWEQKQTTEEVKDSKEQERREVEQYVKSRDELTEKMVKKWDKVEQGDYDSQIKVHNEWISGLRLLYVPAACEEAYSLELQFLRTSKKSGEKMAERMRFLDYAQEAADAGDEQTAWRRLDEADDIGEEIDELLDEMTELQDKRDRKYRELLREYDLY